MATSMARASLTCWPHASTRGMPYVSLSACLSGDGKYCAMTPSIESHPPSPHGEASVPISTTVPARLNASSEKNRSMVAPLPEKKVWNHTSSVRIWLDQMHPGWRSEEEPPQAAHRGSMNGRMTMRSPAAWLSLPMSERSSDLATTLMGKK